MLKNLSSKSWFPYAALALLGFLLYCKSLFFNLTYLDDNVWILDYQWYLKDVHNLFRAFITPDLVSYVFYRPVLNLSFVFNALVGGTNPFIYHLTNIGIHIVNSILVFVLLRKMGYRRNLSLGAACILSVHPVLTTAVAWIPGRTDSFLATFVFLSFIGFLDYIDGRKAVSLAVHLISLLLALFVKETAVALPVMCGLYILMIRGWGITKTGQKVEKGKRIIESPQKQASPATRRLIFSWIGVGLLWFGLRAYTLRSVQKVDLDRALQSLGENLPALISYFGKVIFPFNLSVIPVLEDMPLIFGAIAIVLVLTAVGLTKQKRWNYVLFGIIWFLIFLLPSLVLSFLAHEYRLYIPIIGVLILLLELIQESKKTFISVAVVVLVFFVMSFQYTNRFTDRLTFWESAVKTSPHSPLAHRNLGAMYYLKASEPSAVPDQRTEFFDKALKEYQETLVLNPLEAMVHNNIGLIYMNRERLEEAEAEYKQEISIFPQYANVYFNLGILYYKEGKMAEAVEAWKKTVELEPKYVEAYKYLAVYYYSQKDFTQASFYANELQKRGIVVPDLIKALQKNQ
ncbi:MAG: tetratricopeptide repeat protein [Candidatus Omnitrophica bacterium]|nr:tetratricopeptide repeat protein [Candidatus Omnitrophota bacterium]